MQLKLTEVKTRGDLKRWVLFQHELYKGDPHFIPQFVSDEVEFFSPNNPVYEVATQRMFLAERDGRIVGRVSAVIHRLEQEKLGKRRGRFGWFDCIDDGEVARALLDQCRDWLKAEGCVEMTGPHGFTDLDPEGLLVEGFNELPTVSGSYNFPYYRKLIEDYGFEKEVDYIEHRFALPAEEPRMFAKMREHLKKTTEYRAMTCRSKKELMSYVPQCWAVLEEAFAPLYGVTPLTKKQQVYYTKKYFSFLNPNYVHFVLDKSDQVVGFFVSMPNLSRSFQKAKGKLFPFGLLHVMKESRSPETVDFLLAGAKPGHPSSTITTMLAMEVYQNCKRQGIRFCETNRELETNTTVTRIWSKFDPRLHRRSRMYRMTLS